MALQYFVPPKDLDDEPREPNLRFRMLEAEGLYKRDIFRLPDPKALVSIDGSSVCYTKTAKKTLKPYWDEVFDLFFSNESKLVIELFDRRKMKNEGYLGAIIIDVNDVKNLDPGVGTKIKPLKRELKAVGVFLEGHTKISGTLTV